MSELVTSASEPAYVVKLALSVAPFNPLIEPALFYAGGQAGHRLNLLLHLVRASNKIANLVAEQGYGKSAPLNTLPSWLRRFDSVQQQIRDKAVISQ